MRSLLVSLLVLILCYLCRAQKLSADNDITLQTVESWEEKALTERPGTESEGREQEPEPQHDIWAELRNLRDMVVEQTVELRHLTTRVTAAESLVDELQTEKAAMEARITAAETLVEEAQVENDAQAAELAVSQQKLSSLQQNLTATERQVDELEKQQQGMKAAVQELQNNDRARKLAFSASLLASGEGNTDHLSDARLIYRNVITNIGNHYNPHTGYFTVPVTGVYYFRFTGHVAHSDKFMRLGIVKNGHLIVTSGDRHTTSTDPEDNASNGVTLQMEKGDVVSVQLLGMVWDDQYHRTTFTGFLLFAL